MENHHFYGSLPVGGLFLFRSFVINVVCEKEQVALVEILTYSPKVLFLIFLNSKFLPPNNKFLLSPRNLSLCF